MTKLVVLQRGNTALHCAAQSGLQRCVELLVAANAPLFLENSEKLTPCDLAMQFGHHEIAQFLETKMVFVSFYCFILSCY